MRTRRLIVLMLAATAFAGGPSAQTEQLEVELLAEHTSLQPGSTATIGVRFVMQPGWHVYWKNPGDSGMPPSFSWELPDGFEVSDVRWPAPLRIPMEPFVTFGYDDEVLFMVQLTVPANAEGTVPIALTAAWLTCEEVCVDGNAKLELQLPVNDGAPEIDARWRDLFQATRQALPRDADGVSAEAIDGLVRLSVSDGAPRTYFPENEGEIEFAAAQAVKQSALLLKPADGLPTRLQGVLVLADGRAIAVDVAVAAPRPGPERQQGLSFAFLLGAGLVLVIFLVALAKLAL